MYLNMCEIKIRSAIDSEFPSCSTRVRNVNRKGSMLLFNVLRLTQSLADRAAGQSSCGSRLIQYVLNLLQSAINDQSVPELEAII